VDEICGDPTVEICASANTGCLGATCDTYIGCDNNADCFCGTLAEGGTLCQTSISCEGLTPCPTGACPDGSVCLIGSCCGDPVCVPLSVACSQDNSTASVRSSLPPRPPTGRGRTTGRR
jgi:hypothetical protein